MKSTACTIPLVPPERSQEFRRMSLPPPKAAGGRAVARCISMNAESVCCATFRFAMCSVSCIRRKSHQIVHAQHCSGRHEVHLPGQ